MPSGNTSTGVTKGTGNSAAVVLDLDRHVPYFFTNISSRLSRGASQTYLRHFGIGITDWRVLAVIAGAPGITANGVCAAVGMDKAAVSRSLGLLETRGFVAMAANPDDNRSRSATLTRTGQELHDRVIVVALQRERLLLDCLTAPEIEALISALRKLRKQVSIVNDFEPPEPARPRDAAPPDARRKARA